MKALPLLNNNGFTLIEAMISIFVISIGLMAITKMQLSSIQGNTFAMNTLQATVESSANSELIMSQVFDSLLDGKTDSGVHSDAKYKTNLSYQNVTLYNSNVYQIITITTTWVEKGQNKSFQTTITKLPGEGS